jgi:AcrR family transcriptional regulator
MNKQPEITEATRNYFIDAFCEFYQKRPIEKITVKEIAEKAGYSRATFYNYFKDPYELLESIEGELIARVIESIRKNYDQHQTLEQFVVSFVDITRREERSLNLFLNNPHDTTFMNHLKREALPLLLSIFEISSENHRARYALEFYVSGVIPVIGSWIRSGEEIPAESLAEIIKGILKDGILKQL